MIPHIIKSIISAFFIKEGPEAKQVANEPFCKSWNHYLSDSLKWIVITKFHCRRTEGSPDKNIIWQAASFFDDWLKIAKESDLF